jgi:prepilin-type N-terminal cleavage/methylation domain-containing protein
MKKKRHFDSLNQKGFTLIELISIMIIMGVMGSVAVTKYEGLSDTATEQVLAAAVKELNVRESLTWTNIKISKDGYTSDEDVYAALDTDLGPNLKWNPGPGIGGGILYCGTRSYALVRTPSSYGVAARWH